MAPERLFNKLFVSESAGKGRHKAIAKDFI